jgi:hypothetical protein
VFLSSSCRGDAPPDAFLARAATLGADGIVLDFSVASVEEWALPLARSPTPLVGVCFPALGAPRPAAGDREERLASRQRAQAFFPRAAELGARVVVVRLGELEWRLDQAGIFRAFARRTLDDQTREKLLGERAALASFALDRARYAVEALLGAAGSLTVALATRAHFPDIPTDLELRTLLEDFRGAPLAPWPDAAVLTARQLLGQDTDPGLLSLAAGAFLTDAAGLTGGLPWGRGDVDHAVFLSPLPPDALRVVHAGPFATDDELAQALATPPHPA